MYIDTDAADAIWKIGQAYFSIKRPLAETYPDCHEDRTRKALLDAIERIATNKFLVITSESK